MARKKPTATQKMRTNVNRAIKRLEQKGYRFTPEFKESVKTAKYQTLKSLQRKGYSKLKTSADTNYTWEEKRRFQDYVDIDYVSDISEGSLIYDSVMQRIEEQPGEGAERLKRMLKSEIDRYGFNTVMQAMSNAPEDFISATQAIVSYKKKSEVAEAFRALGEVIKGARPDTAEAMENGDILDAMDTFDDEFL